MKRKRDGNGKVRDRDDGIRCGNTKHLYICVCQRFARPYAGTLLRGCLISSSANQTPYTQNSIRSLHKRASQFGAPCMHNAPVVCFTRGRDLLYRTNGKHRRKKREGGREREREREELVMKIIVNSCHCILLSHIGEIIRCIKIIGITFFL